MVNKKVLTRNNKPTDELQRSVDMQIKGVKISYIEVHYLDFEVNEDTGMIDINNQVAYYIKIK